MRSTEAVAVVIVAVLLPGGEQLLGDLQAGQTELLLRSEPLAMRREIAHQVSPAELSPFGVEVVVGPPAIRAGDAGELLAQQRLGLALVAVGGDAKERRTRGEGAPERALAAAQAPAGLIDVERRGGADVAEQVLVGLLKRRGRPPHDRVDRAGGERAPNSSPISSTVSRRETRFLTARVAMAAYRRGPKAPRGTPAGSSAHVLAPQSGQRRR